MGDAGAADPPEDVEKAVGRLFAIYLEHSRVYLSKAMWRDAMAVSTQQPDSPSGRLYAGVTHKGVIRAMLSLATGWDMEAKPPVRLARMVSPTTAIRPLR